MQKVTKQDTILLAEYNTFLTDEFYYKIGLTLKISTFNDSRESASFQYDKIVFLYKEKEIFFYKPALYTST